MADIARGARRSFHKDNPHCCRTWDQLRDEWQRRSGENLSRARIWQIVKRAEAKVHDALKRDPASREVAHG